MQLKVLQRKINDEIHCPSIVKFHLSALHLYEQVHAQFKNIRTHTELLLFEQSREIPVI